MLDDPQQIVPQLAGCLDAWGLEPAAIDLVSQSENIVYKLVTNDGEMFALRVHRPGYHSLAALNSEHVWTGALREAGFVIPHGRPTLDGEQYVPVPINGANRYVGLIEWLDGASLYDLTKDGQNEALLQSTLMELGALMARLHNHAEIWVAPSGFTRHCLDVDGFFGKQPHWDRYWEVPLMRKEEREVLDRTRPRIIEQLTELGQKPSVFGMAHADLHHGNVFITESGLYLIDFDDAGFSWYLYDLAVALQEYQHRDDFEQLKGILIAGYLKERAISQGELDLLPLFLHIRSRATIGWASARPELDNAERIRRLIERTCVEAEQLLGSEPLGSEPFGSDPKGSDPKQTGDNI